MTPSVEPWTRQRLTLSSIGGLVVACSLLVAWSRVSATADVRAQLGWVGLGVAGLGVAGAISAQWILAGRRAVGLELRAVLGHPDLTSKLAAPRSASTASTSPEAVFAGEAMTRFHTADCPLAIGKAVRPVTTAQRRRLRPCDICEPSPR
jgi:hypothetical protein